MAKNTYRQGAYGPVLDRQAGAADAFAAGQKQVKIGAKRPKNSKMICRLVN